MRLGVSAFLERRFWVLVCMQLVIGAALLVWSAAQESETVDEGAHLVAGYSYWKTSDFRLLPSHPPLAELLCAAPLLALDLRFAPSPEQWKAANEYAIAHEFLYYNRVPADTILLAGRLVTILFTLLLGLSIAVWMRGRFGAGAAIFSLLLFLLDPTIAAHGRYVTTDLMLTAFLFWSVLSWLNYLERPSDSALLRTGVLVGCALATKFSAPIVYPILGVLYLLHRRRTKARLPHSYLEISGALAFVPFAIVFTTFFFDARSFLGDPVIGPRLLARTSGLTRILAQLPIPAYYYLRGAHILLRDIHAGHHTYLLGRILDRGAWYYFPVAFAVKTPVATLVLTVSTGALALRRLAREGRVPFVWAGLSAACACYLAVSIATRFNIGIRHLMPLYPFLFVLIGSVIFAPTWGRLERPLRWSACLLLGLLAIETAAVYPDYLTFFNALAGGPSSGPRYLMDSNLDWGQDLKKLKRWLDRNPGTPLCLSYYGQAQPEYYGIRAAPLPAIRSDDDLSKVDCVAAVSANNLFNEVANPFAALRRRTPNRRIGNSIYLFDLRKPGGTAQVDFR